MPRLSTLTRFVLGALLLATAALKLYGLGVSAVPRVGWFAQPGVQLAAAEWELVLGLWLLSGAYPVGSWLAAVGTFLAFAGVSGYLGLTGVSSCGCLGAVHASPWAAFAADVAALCLLAVSRPFPVERTTHRAARTGGLSVVPAVAALLAGLGVVAVSAWYGSVDAGLARLRGAPVGVDHSYLDYGEVTAGTAVTREARVWNFTSRPVRVYAGTSDCSCITTDGLPLTIEAGGSAVIPVTLKAPAGADNFFTRTAEVWTDAEGQPRVRFVLGCRVIPSPTSVAGK